MSDLVTLRADLERHQNGHDTKRLYVLDFCTVCELAWPCDAARALAALDRLTETVAQLRTEQAATASQLATLVEAVKPVMPTLAYYIGPNSRTAVSQESHDLYDALRAALSDLSAAAAAHDERIRAEERGATIRRLREHTPAAVLSDLDWRDLLRLSGLDALLTPSKPAPTQKESAE